MDRRGAVTVTIRLSGQEEARLSALAERTGRTKSFYVRTALREYLTDLEDAYAADAALRRFEADGGRTRPASELVRKLGITAEEWAEAERELRDAGQW
jgi:RHH-type rel operon transcriptional repressor/antitoxin RelB